MKTVKAVHDEYLIAETDDAARILALYVLEGRLKPLYAGRQACVEAHARQPTPMQARYHPYRIMSVGGEVSEVCRL